MKRYIVNAIALLFIAAIASLAVFSYPRQSTLSPGKAGLPSLKTLRPIPVGGLDLDLENGEIQVALEIDAGTNPDYMASDIVEIYRWGRSYFRPFKCGPEYPPNLCKIGVVTIYLVSVSGGEIMTPNGPVKGYLTFAIMSLDQVQIDKLLEDPPRGLDELDEFFEAAEKSEGGSIKTYSQPVPFTGFK